MRPDHLWVLAFNPQSTEAPQAKQLTSGKFEEDQPLWSKDGTQIYFTSTRVDEPYYEEPRTTIYSIPAAGGEPRKFIELDFGAQGLSLSPDGTRLAFRGSRRVQPIQSYTQPDLWVMDLKAGATAKNLTVNFDYDVGSGVGGDNAPPRAPGRNVPLWSSDGRNIIDVVAKEGRANLYYFDAATGAAAEFSRGNQDIEAFRMTREGRVVAMVSTPMMVGDLFVFDPPHIARAPNEPPRRLTNVNEKL